MEKTRLWELLRALSPADLFELGKFAESPAFNYRPQVIRLLGYLRACLKKGRSPEKTAAWEHTFPGLTFDDARFHLTVSLLLGVAEQYLLVRNYRNNPRKAALTLAAEYRALGLTRHVEKQWRTLDAAQESEPHQNVDYFHHAFLIEQERYNFLAGQQRMAELNLQAISDHLDVYYLAQKLRQVCFALAHQTVAGARYDHGLLPEVLQALELGKFADVPAVSVYYHCYRALTEPQDEQRFRTFKALLLAHSVAFPASERRDLLLLATNYCIRRFNEGEPLYAREALDLYRAGLHDDTLLLNGLLSRFTYRNIVSMALIGKELDWSEQFIYAYRIRLEDKHRDAAFAFNLARLEYARGRYDRALPLLQNAEYSDLLLNLSAKTIALKIFFETGQYDLLDAHLDALRNFLRRHRELGYHREHYRNLLRFLQKILKTGPADRPARAAIAAEIRQTKVVAEREWLLGLV